MDNNKIKKIESYNNKNIAYDIEFINSSEFKKLYYSESEYLEKLKGIKAGKSLFTPPKTGKLKFFIRQEWDFIRILYTRTNVFVSYFIRRKDIDSLIEVLKESITMKEMLSILHDKEWFLFDDINLKYLVPINFQKGAFNFYEKRIFERILYCKDFSTMSISECKKIGEYTTSLGNQIILKNNLIRNNYIDIKEVLRILDVKHPYFLTHNDFESLECNCIIGSGVYLFLKSDIEVMRAKKMSSILLKEGFYDLKNIDGSLNEPMFMELFKEYNYKIPIYYKNTFIEKKKCDIIKDKIIRLKERYLKEESNNINVLELVKMHKNDIRSNTSVEKIKLKFYKINGYLSLTTAFKELVSNDDVNFNIKTFRARVRSLYKADNKKIKIINQNYFIKETFVDEQKKLFLESRLIEDLSAFDSKRNFTASVKRKKIKCYNISLIHLSKQFIAKKDYEKLSNSMMEIRNSEAIDKYTFMDKINNIFLGFRYCKKDIPLYLRELVKSENLKIYTPDNLGNFGIQILYPKETVEYLIEKMKERIFSGNYINLHNISTEEYFELTKDTLSEKFYTKEEFINVLETTKLDYQKIYMRDINTIKRLLKGTDIKCIQMAAPIAQQFYSKKETDKVVKELMKYINLEGIKKEYNTTILRTIIAKVRMDNLPLVNKTHTYILKSELPGIFKYMAYKKEYKKCCNIFEGFLVKIKYYKNKNESNLPKTLGYFYDFISELSNNRSALSIAEALYGVYNLLCDNFTKEFEMMNKLEIIDKLENIKKNCDKITHFLYLLNFNNYLYIQKKSLYFWENTIEKDEEIIEPYEAESYIELIVVTSGIIKNKQKLQKIYRDWRKSTCLVYVYLHFCLAWRKFDLIDKLPLPDERLIMKITANKDFINWLEEGNELSMEEANLVCEYIEILVDKLRIEVGKTGEDLVCIIPEEFKYNVATLLCINWQNREYARKTKQFIYTERALVRQYTERNKINKVFFEEFGIDLAKLLDGGFLGTRAVKSFFSLIVEKSEELGLAYGYYMSQLLRAHRAPKEIGKYLSNTTKIYVKKDVSHASVEAFTLGTMSSIKHILLELVDPQYRIIEKANKISLLNLNLLEIEEVYENLANKTYRLKKLMSNLLVDEKMKNSFLKNLLYGKGQSSYSEYEGAKCLLKALKQQNTIIGIDVLENTFCPIRKKSCIDCDYLVGMRYFIYEFEKEFNKVLLQIENTESNLIRDKYLRILKNKYIPIIFDMQDVWGKETVKKLLDEKRFKDIIISLKKGEIGNG